MSSTHKRICLSIDQHTYGQIQHLKQLTAGRLKISDLVEDFFARVNHSVDLAFFSDVQSQAPDITPFAVRQAIESLVYRRPV